MPNPKTTHGAAPKIRTIHKNVRTLSMRCRMSQHKIGRAMGLSQAMVSRWANATSTPDAIQAAELAVLFDVPMEVLVNRDVEAIDDEALEKIRHVVKAIDMIGYDEAHRRLLIAEPRVGKGGGATVVSAEDGGERDRQQPSRRAR